MTAARHQDLLARLEDALARSDGEVELSAWAGRLGSTRFAASQPTQSVDVESAIVQARVAVDRRVGAARAGSLDGAAIAQAIARARAIAEAQPRDPDFPGFDDGRAPAAAVDAWDEATAASGAGERADRLAAAFAVAARANLTLSGSIAAVDAAQAVATRAGSRRAYRFTTFRLDAIASGERSSGWAGSFGHRAAGCDAAAVARAAVERAFAGRDPVELPPGAYDVVLEPKALAEALEWLAFGSLGPRALREGSSALAGRLGEAVTAPSITLGDDALSDDPLALRAPFDAEGTPKRRVALIERGVARGVVYDRLSARRDGAAPTGHAIPLGDEMPFDLAAPQHLQLAPGEVAAADLLARVERGLLVTRFHYVNGLLDTRRALTTGMTRDGLLLVEEGRIVRGVRNLRWTEPLLEALARTDGISRERAAVAAAWSTASGGGLLVPSILVRGFHFTGASR